MGPGPRCTARLAEQRAACHVNNETMDTSARLAVVKALLAFLGVALLLHGSVQPTLALTPCTDEASFRSDGESTGGTGSPPGVSSIKVSPAAQHMTIAQCEKSRL